MLNSAPTQYAALCNHFPALPLSALIDSAFDYARDNMPTYLFNHVTRSWIYSTRVAEKNAIKYDAEVVAVSTLMHDIVPVWHVPAACVRIILRPPRKYRSWSACHIDAVT
jgi:hypothetical protein